MPRFTLDLHNHTPLLPRDYRGSLDTTPREIVETALSVGIDVYAVTDHFSLDFYERLAAAADEVAAETDRRLLIVPGAELKVRHGSDEVHVVALLPPDRADRAFAEMLGLLGLASPVAPVEDLQRVHVTHDPAAVFRIVEILGGIALVGHVDRAFGTYRLIESSFSDVLLSAPSVRAVEVIDPRHTEMLSSYGVTVVHASDSHSLSEIGRRTSEMELAELSFAALRDALAAPSALAV